MSLRTPSQRHRDNQEGFTLIELIIVVAILPLIVGAIGVALISTIFQANSIQAKTTDSGDTSIVAANFVKDVQSATFITTNALLTDPYPCGTHTPILSLQFGTSSGTSNPEVSYDVVKQTGANGSTTNLLDRVYCATGSDTGPGTVTASAVLAHNVQSSLIPTILGDSCSANSCSSATTEAGQEWAPTEGVGGITFSITSAEPHGTTFNYALTGTPRLSNDVSRGQTTDITHPPLLMLGTTGEAVSCGGNGSLTVTGTAALNTSSDPALATNGTKVNVTANQIYTDAPQSPDPLSGKTGTITPNAPSGPPVETQDPLSGLTPPSSTGMTVYGGGTLVGPGVYTTQVKVQSATPIANGIYIFEAGLSETGNGVITGMNTDGSASVLFYITGGAFSMAGNGNDDLEPLASPPSPAPGVVIWQASTDTSALSLTGNGTSDLIDGTVYAPDSSAVSVGGNGSMTVGSLVANGQLSCGGNGSLTIG